MSKEMEVEMNGVTQETFAFFESEELNRNIDFRQQDKQVNPRGTNLAKSEYIEFSIDDLPENELTEIVSHNELDAIYALLPAISRICEQDRWVTLIGAPANLDEKVFALYGIDISKVLLIHPKNISQDTSVMNKALKNGKSGIVVCWADKIPNRFLAQWRKSVKQGECTGVWVNLSGVPSRSCAIAATAQLVAAEKYVKIINNMQFGVNTLQKAEFVLPKFTWAFDPMGWQSHANKTH